MHSSSQAWGQIRPQTLGKGLGSLATRYASSHRPWAASAMYPCAEVCAGQVEVQGAQPRWSIANVAGTALAKGREIALRPVTPRSNSLSSSTGQAAAQAPQPTHWSLTKRGWWRTRTRNSPGGPLTAVTSERVLTWMRESVAALASRGPSEHIAQSSVGKVLERRAMYPPRDCSLSTRWTSIPAPASSSAAESPPMPPPTTSAERCRKVRDGSSGRCDAARATAAASTVSALR